MLLVYNNVFLLVITAFKVISKEKKLTASWDV